MVFYVRVQMYTKALLFGIILLAIASCGVGKNTIPKEVMDKRVMVPILVDIHLADAIIEKRSSIEKPDTAMTQNIYQQIFQAHHITRNQFYNSYHFYETHPVILNELYAEVITELSKKDAQLGK